MRKLNKIVSLCLINLMGISSVCASEKAVSTQESNVSGGGLSKKQNDNGDPKKRSNTLRNVSLVSLFGVILTCGTLWGYDRYEFNLVKTHAPAYVIDNLDNLSRKENSPPAFVEHWKFVDKNLLKSLIEKMQDYCIEHYSRTPPDLSEVQTFFHSANILGVGMLTISKFIMNVLGLPDGNSPESFPNIGEIDTFVFISGASPKLYIDVEHCVINGKESIKFTINEEYK